MAESCTLFDDLNWDLSWGIDKSSLGSETAPSKARNSGEYYEKPTISYFEFYIY